MSEKLGDSSAAKKSEMYTGMQGCWIKARRNNCCYYLNKIFSILIAGFFGLITLYLKLMAMKLIKRMDDAGGDGENDGNKQYRNCVNRIHN